MFESMKNTMGGMFAKISPGMCRISMNGDIAIKTSTGYKTYDIKSGTLINCSDFVMDGMDEMFFCVPVTDVKVGDIILVKGTPRVIIEVTSTQLKVVNYENSTIETVLPERHIILGSTYFYSKIFSPFSSMVTNGKDGSDSMIKMMMMNEMFGGHKDGGNNMMQTVMMMNMMGAGANPFSSMFDGLFKPAVTEDKTVKEEE